MLLQSRAMHDYELLRDNRNKTTCRLHCSLNDPKRQWPCPTQGRATINPSSKADEFLREIISVQHLEITPTRARNSEQLHCLFHKKTGDQSAHGCSGSSSFDSQTPSELGLIDPSFIQYFDKIRLSSDMKRR